MIKPVNNNVLLKEIEENIKTSTGLLINKKETNIKKAKVIKTADNTDLVKERDIVLIFREDIEEFVYRDEQYLIVKLDKIQAIVEE